MPWNSQLKKGRFKKRGGRGKEQPDWVTKVLGGNSHGGTQHADHGAALVEELEGPVVDVGLIELEVVGEIAEKVRHGDPPDSSRDPAASPPARRSTLTSSQLGSNRRAKQRPESLKLQRSLQSPVTELGPASKPRETGKVQDWPSLPKEPDGHPQMY